MVLRQSSVVPLAVALIIGVATACGGDGPARSTIRSLPSGVPDDAQEATVVDVLDADTVLVTLGIGTAPTTSAAVVEVAVAGVDRPVSGTCLAADSDAFAERELATGAIVYMLPDAQDTGPDGALLRYVWDGDGELYNDKLLRHGFAKVAPAPPIERFRQELADAESEARAAGRGVWGCPVTSTTVRPTTTVPRTTTSRLASTSTTSPPRLPLPTIAPLATGPGGRTVSLGETFSLVVGETVSVQGQGLLVTYSAVGSDSRCRPGQQCLVAGDATVTVTVTAARVGTPSANLDLNTAAPTAVRYGSRTVELVQLGFGRPPVATLRVT